MLSVLDLEPPLYVNSRLVLMHGHGRQYHGMNAVDCNKHVKIPFKASPVYANKICKTAEYPLYLLALVSFESTHLIVQLKDFNRLYEKGDPTCRLVMQYPLYTVPVRFFHGKHPPTLPHGNEPVL
jgi:hypothetical protein